MVESRSYSRNSGCTSEEMEISSSGSATASASRSACSCAGLTKAKRKQIATAAAPLSRTAWTIRAISAWSSAKYTPPSASTRSAASSLSSRGTSGGGWSFWKSNMWGRVCRPISKRSRKPFVVTSAIRSPLPWISALVATVVPWLSRRAVVRSMPFAAASASSPANTARAGSSGVDGVL